MAVSNLYPDFLVGPLTEVDDMATESGVASSDEDLLAAVPEDSIPAVTVRVFEGAELPLWEHQVNPIWRTVPLLKRRILWILFGVITILAVGIYMVVRLFTGMSVEPPVVPTLPPTVWPCTPNCAYDPQTCPDPCEPRCG